MAFKMWKSDEKENEYSKDLENSEKIKNLENKISELQFILNQYENHNEEKEVMYSNQFTEINDWLQNLFEKEEVHFNKMIELEKELQTYKEEVNACNSKVEALERRIENLQKEDTETKTEMNTEVSKSKSKIKKKRNIEFDNQSQFFLQQGNFPETIQRVYPEEQSEETRKDYYTSKKTPHNRLVPNPNSKNQYYPKDLRPTRSTVFNPLKYS
jgi:chromosome segregation ATPase